MSSSSINYKCNKCMFLFFVFLQNIDSLSKASMPEMETGASTSTMEAPGEAGNKV